jgi:hypothetical protein
MTNTIKRESVRKLVEQAEVGDSLRVENKTGLPEQSALQPEETTVEKKPDGRWHYVTMLGDPLWFDDDELVDAVLEAEYAISAELVPKGAPDK